jgi:hypothetical protein
VSEAVHTRLGLLTGLLVAATAAAWWLGATRLSLVQAGSTDAVAGSALVGLWLARASLLPPFALRAGATQGARVALVAALTLVIAAWPVVLPAAHASTLPASRLLLAEALLLGGSALLAAVGAGLRSLFRSIDDALIIATMLGIAIAVATWTWGGAWTRTLS